MPKYYHLTEEEKNLICQLKLDGISGSRIAQQLGKSKQSISLYLNNLPSGNEEQERISSGLPEEVSRQDAYEVCRMYNAGLNMSKIKDLSELSEEVIWGIFSYVKRPHRTGKHPQRHCYFPNVKNWMDETGISYQEFADQLGISQFSLKNMLYGKNYLTKDVAVRMKEVTGLKIKEIFSEFYDEWKKKYEKELK